MRRSMRSAPLSRRKGWLSVSRHRIEVIDPYDERPVVCLGCGRQGDIDNPITGDCPTPYKSRKQLLLELAASNQLLLEVANRGRLMGWELGLVEQIDTHLASEGRTNG